MLPRTGFHCRSRPPAVLFHSSLARETILEANSVSSEASLSQTRIKRLQRPQLTAAVVLNRSPIITRTPTGFERAYYAYQARIRRALHNPFPLDFYFKQGSLLETRFNMEEKKRERRAFGPTFGVEEFVSKEIAAAEKAAADQLALQEGETEELMQRIHVSDISRELKSLDRKGKRNIYLLLRTTEGGKDTWRFPEGGVENGELLHQAAQRELHVKCGSSMDTWIVSRNPIGFYRPPTLSDVLEAEKITFFFKAHIMAGQVKPNVNTVQDFAWLTKQEIGTCVCPEYWDGIKDILSDY